MSQENIPKLSFSGKIHRLELEEGTWIEYKMIPYEDFAEICGEMNEKKDDKTAALLANLRLLEKCVINWSDQDTPVTSENIKNLGTDVIIYLATQIWKKLNPEKKSSQ